MLNCDFYSNTWNHLTVCKKDLRFVYECYLQNVFTNYIYIYIYIYVCVCVCVCVCVYKQDLALNNLQLFLYNKTQTKNQPTNHFN